VEVTQTFRVAAEPDKVWALLSDVRAVAECMPGLELLDELPGGAYRGRFAVKVGPVSARIEGEGRLERDDAQRTGTIEGKGVDKRGGSRVKGLMRYSVVPEGSGSTVEVQADMTLSGPLAQVGRTAIIEDVARALTREFSANLEQRLAARPSPDGGSAEAEPSHAAVRAPGAEERPAVKPFDAGRAVSRGSWRRFVDWLKRLFR